MITWNQTGFDLPAVAEAVGPFCTAEFIDVVSAFDPGTPLPAESEDAFIPLRRCLGEILFAGDTELTDYHTPFGEGSAALIGAVAAEETPERFVLDSLPPEAAKPLVLGLEEAGWAVESRVHEVSAVVDLPDTFDQYLSDVGKKERHEIRRKRRRYERIVGEVRHETHRGPGWAFDEFVRLHRRAEGEKGSFLNDDHLRLFAKLAELDGWRIDVLRTPQDGAAAAVFGYSDPTGYYLYNSAYEAELREASPGAVLLGTMIERAVSERMPRFDFLKGDEGYKFRLGARRRDLFEVVATPGGAA